MQRKAFMKAAGSSLIVAVTMVGCSGVALDRPGIASNKASDRYAGAATTALGKHDATHAVASAEAAVAGDPGNAGYRALLGRAYLLDGRYTSARTSFTDAMTLGNRDSRTIVSLALVQVALGDDDGARHLLNANRADLPAADYGLAIALAGDAQTGVQALGDAVRGPDADAKMRQNLAYAYALAGMWPQAKLMASQDLLPEEAARRVADWAMTASPSAAPQRVAMLTGINPRADDAGLPARLALAPAAPDAAPVMTAEAETAPPVPVAIDEPAQASPQVDTAPAPMIAGIRFASSVPVVQPLPRAAQPHRASYPPSANASAATRVIRAPASPMRTAANAFLPTMRTASMLQPVAGGGFLVQLGAYDSPAVAKEKFAGLSRRNADIARFPLVQTSATVNGKLYYRAAIGGFADAASAATMCARVRASGGQCFVRAGETPAGKASSYVQAKGKAVAAATPLKPKQYAAR